LQPLHGKKGEAAALIFLIGDKCDQKAYINQLKMIQNNVPFPLWVGIPKIIDDQPIPVGISIYMEAIKTELRLHPGFKV